jgi:hypothetical protein
MDPAVICVPVWVVVFVVELAVYLLVLTGLWFFVIRRVG